MLLLGFLCPVPVKAETLIAARTIRSQSVLTPDDVVVADHDTPGALRDPADAVGLETRVVLYAGRPVRAADIGPVTLIDRNQVIPLIFTTVRRQSFWNQWHPNLRESLAHLVGFIMRRAGGDASGVLRASFV